MILSPEQANDFNCKLAPVYVQSFSPHVPEHALEVELPFLQTVLASFQVVPLVVGDAAPQGIAYVLRQLWGGPETLIVVSSDLSHCPGFPRSLPNRREYSCFSGLTTRRTRAADGYRHLGYPERWSSAGIWTTPPVDCL